MSNSPRAKARRTARSHLSKFQRGLLASGHSSQLVRIHSRSGFFSRLRGKFHSLWDFVKMLSNRLKKTKRVQLQIEKAERNIKHNPAAVVPQKR